MIEIAASILSADFSQLGAQLREAFEAGITRVHVDVMDGQFVPNLSMGPHVLKAVRAAADPFGANVAAHLMIVQPERFLAAFIDSGAQHVIVHLEGAAHLISTLQRIRKLGATPGVAINPGTPLVMLEEILSEVGVVMVMGVEPGFGGQLFRPATLQRVAKLKGMLVARSLEGIEIAVDGGINASTIAAVAGAGASYAVVGSALFNTAASITQNLQTLRSSAQ